MNYPKKFNDLIQAFQKLPGVGAKTAERYAYTMLDWDPETLNDFLDAMNHMKTGIQRCKICGNLSSGEKCSICADPDRNRNMICVVESPKDIAAIESMQEYNGVYHVLNGTINMKKGILPDQLNIQSLLDRINEETQEVILATDPTMDGETTALYIEKLLKDKVKITRLAYGIPIGGHLDYTDSLTLLRAFQGRK
ncbi:recombination mediator RecR [Catenisphaera adipataccumulans]|uniref:Recombination protein RecR n=1 Tax=Catenisphaera adipataccumulans TaxID=700500 RepID=A0A7W8CYA5_9FIRM|nr:recombination mediator RecR [Catenisphaera adipataccumulans]MBB5183837.1 recombination protein RecR [Catenisphaera adipataccumulans]